MSRLSPPAVRYGLNRTTSLDSGYFASLQTTTLTTSTSSSTSTTVSTTSTTTLSTSSTTYLVKTTTACRSNSSGNSAVVGIHSIDRARGSPETQRTLLSNFRVCENSRGALVRLSDEGRTSVVHDRKTCDQKLQKSNVITFPGDSIYSASSSGETGGTQRQSPCLRRRQAHTNKFVTQNTDAVVQEEINAASTFEKEQRGRYYSRKDNIDINNLNTKSSNSVSSFTQPNFGYSKSVVDLEKSDLSNSTSAINHSTNIKSSTNSSSSNNISTKHTASNNSSVSSQSLSSSSSSTRGRSLKRDVHSREYWNNIRSLSRDSKQRQEERDQQLQRQEVQERQRRAQVLANRRRQREDITDRFLRQPLHRYTKRRLSHSPKSPPSKLTPPTVRATKSVPDLEKALRIVRGDFSSTSDQHEVGRYHSSCQDIATSSQHIDSEVGSKKYQNCTSQSLIDISKSTSSLHTQPGGLSRLASRTHSHVPPGRTPDGRIFRPCYGVRQQPTPANKQTTRFEQPIVIRENQKPYPTRSPQELIELKRRRANPVRALAHYRDISSKMGTTQALQETFKVTNAVRISHKQPLMEYLPVPNSRLLLVEKPKLNRRRSMPDLAEYKCVSSAVVYESISTLGNLEETNNVVLVPTVSSQSVTGKNIFNNQSTYSRFHSQTSETKWSQQLAKMLRDDTEKILDASPLLQKSSQGSSSNKISSHSLHKETHRKDWISKHTSISSMRNSILSNNTVDTGVQTDFPRPKSGATVHQRVSYLNEDSDQVYYDSLEEDEIECKLRLNNEAFFISVDGISDQTENVHIELPPHLSARLQDLERKKLEKQRKPQIRQKFNTSPNRTSLKYHFGDPTKSDNFTQAVHEVINEVIDLSMETNSISRTSELPPVPSNGSRASSARSNSGHRNRTTLSTLPDIETQPVTNHGSQSFKFHDDTLTTVGDVATLGIVRHKSESEESPSRQLTYSLTSADSLVRNVTYTVGSDVASQSSLDVLSSLSNDESEKVQIAPEDKEEWIDSNTQNIEHNLAGKDYVGTGISSSMYDECDDSDSESDEEVLIVERKEFEISSTETISQNSTRIKVETKRQSGKRRNKRDVSQTLEELESQIMDRNFNKESSHNCDGSYNANELETNSTDAPGLHNGIKSSEDDLNSLRSESVLNGSINSREDMLDFETDDGSVCTESSGRITVIAAGRHSASERSLDTDSPIDASVETEDQEAGGGQEEQDKEEKVIWEGQEIRENTDEQEFDEDSEEQMIGRELEDDTNEQEPPSKIKIINKFTSLDDDEEEQEEEEIRHEAGEKSAACGETEEVSEEHHHAASAEDVIEIHSNPEYEGRFNAAPSSEDIGEEYVGNASGNEENAKELTCDKTIFAVDSRSVASDITGNIIKSKTFDIDHETESQKTTITDSEEIETSSFIEISKETNVDLQKKSSRDEFALETNVDITDRDDCVVSETNSEGCCEMQTGTESDCKNRPTKSENSSSSVMSNEDQNCVSSCERNVPPGGFVEDDCNGVQNEVISEPPLSDDRHDNEIIDSDEEEKRYEINSSDSDDLVPSNRNDFDDSANLGETDRKNSPAVKPTLADRKTKLGLARSMAIEPMPGELEDSDSNDNDESSEDHYIPDAILHENFMGLEGSVTSTDESVSSLLSTIEEEVEPSGSARSSNAFSDGSRTLEHMTLDSDDKLSDGTSMQSCDVDHFIDSDNLVDGEHVVENHQHNDHVSDGEQSIAREQQLNDDKQIDPGEGDAISKIERLEENHQCETGSQVNIESSPDTDQTVWKVHVIEEECQVDCEELTNAEHVDGIEIDNMDQTHDEHMEETAIDTEEQTNVENLEETVIDAEEQTNAKHVEGTVIDTHNQTNTEQTEETEIDTDDWITDEGTKETTIDTKDQTDDELSEETKIDTNDQTFAELAEHSKIESQQLDSEILINDEKAINIEPEIEPQMDVELEIETEQVDKKGGMVEEQSMDAEYPNDGDTRMNSDLQVDTGIEMEINHQSNEEQGNLSDNLESETQEKRRVFKVNDNQTDVEKNCRDTEPTEDEVRNNDQTVHTNEEQSTAHERGNAGKDVCDEEEISGKDEYLEAEENASMNHPSVEEQVIAEEQDFPSENVIDEESESQHILFIEREQCIGDNSRFEQMQNHDSELSCNNELDLGEKLDRDVQGIDENVLHNNVLNNQEILDDVIADDRLCHELEKSTVTEKNVDEEQFCKSKIENDNLTAFMNDAAETSVSVNLEEMEEIQSDFAKENETIIEDNTLSIDSVELQSNEISFSETKVVSSELAETIVESTLTSNVITTAELQVYYELLEGVTSDFTADTVEDCDIVDEQASASRVGGELDGQDESGSHLEKSLNDCFSRPNEDSLETNSISIDELTDSFEQERGNHITDIHELAEDVMDDCDENDESIEIDVETIMKAHDPMTQADNYYSDVRNATENSLLSIADEESELREKESETKDDELDSVVREGDEESESVDISELIEELPGSTEEDLTQDILADPLPIIDYQESVDHKYLTEDILFQKKRKKSANKVSFQEPVFHIASGGTDEGLYDPNSIYNQEDVNDDLTEVLVLHGVEDLPHCTFGDGEESLETWSVQNDKDSLTVNGDTVDVDSQAQPDLLLEAIDQTDINCNNDQETECNQKFQNDCRDEDQQDGDSLQTKNDFIDAAIDQMETDLHGEADKISEYDQLSESCSIINNYSSTKNDLVEGDLNTETDSQEELKYHDEDNSSESGKDFPVEDDQPSTVAYSEMDISEDDRCTDQRDDAVLSNADAENAVDQRATDSPIDNGTQLKQHQLAVSNPSMDDILAEKNQQAQDNPTEEDTFAEENQHAQDNPTEDVSFAEENQQAQDNPAEDVTFAEENQQAQDNPTEDVSFAEENQQAQDNLPEDDTFAEENQQAQDNPIEDVTYAEENQQEQDDPTEEVTFAEENQQAQDNPTEDVTIAEENQQAQDNPTEDVTFTEENQQAQDNPAEDVTFIEENQQAQENPVEDVTFAEENQQAQDNPTEDDTFAEENQQAQDNPSEDVTFDRDNHQAEDYPNKENMPANSDLKVEDNTNCDVDVDENNPIDEDTISKDDLQTEEIPSGGGGPAENNAIRDDGGPAENNAIRDDGGPAENNAIRDDGGPAENNAIRDDGGPAENNAIRDDGGPAENNAIRDDGGPAENNAIRDDGGPAENNAIRDDGGPAENNAIRDDGGPAENNATHDEQTSTGDRTIYNGDQQAKDNALVGTLSNANLQPEGKFTYDDVSSSGNLHDESNPVYFFLDGEGASIGGNEHTDGYQQAENDVVVDEQTSTGPDDADTCSVEVKEDLMKQQEIEHYLLESTVDDINSRAKTKYESENNICTKDSIEIENDLSRDDGGLQADEKTQSVEANAEIINEKEVEAIEEVLESNHDDVTLSNQVNVNLMQPEEITDKQDRARQFVFGRSNAFDSNFKCSLRSEIEEEIKHSNFGFGDPPSNLAKETDQIQEKINPEPEELSSVIASSCTLDEVNSDAKEEDRYEPFNAHLVKSGSNSLDNVEEKRKEMYDNLEIDIITEGLCSHDDEQSRGDGNSTSDDLSIPDNQGSLEDTKSLGGRISPQREATPNMIGSPRGHDASGAALAKKKSDSWIFSETFNSARSANTMLDLQLSIETESDNQRSDEEYSPNTDIPDLIQEVSSRSQVVSEMMNDLINNSRNDNDSDDEKFVSPPPTAEGDHQKAFGKNLNVDHEAQVLCSPVSSLNSTIEISPKLIVSRPHSSSTSRMRCLENGSDVSSSNGSQDNGQPLTTSPSTDSGVVVAASNLLGQREDLEKKVEILDLRISSAATVLSSTNTYRPQSSTKSRNTTPETSKMSSRPQSSKQRKEALNRIKSGHSSTYKWIQSTLESDIVEDDIDENIEDDIIYRVEKNYYNQPPPESEFEDQARRLWEPCHPGLPGAFEPLPSPTESNLTSASQCQASQYQDLDSPDTQKSLENETVLSASEESDTSRRVNIDENPENISAKLFKTLERRRLRRHRNRASSIDNPIRRYKPASLSSLDFLLASLPRFQAHESSECPAAAPAPVKHHSYSDCQRISNVKSGDEVTVQVIAGRQMPDVKVTASRQVKLFVQVGPDENFVDVDGGQKCSIHHHHRRQSPEKFISDEEYKIRNLNETSRRQNDRSEPLRRPRPTAARSEMWFQEREAKILTGSDLSVNAKPAKFTSSINRNVGENAGSTGSRYQRLRQRGHAGSIDQPHQTANIQRKRPDHATRKSYSLPRSSQDTSPSKRLFLKSTGRNTISSVKNAEETLRQEEIGLTRVHRTTSNASHGLSHLQSNKKFWRNNTNRIASAQSINDRVNGKSTTDRATSAQSITDRATSAQSITDRSTSALSFTERTTSALSISSGMSYTEAFGNVENSQRLSPRGQVDRMLSDLKNYCSRNLTQRRQFPRSPVVPAEREARSQEGRDRAQKKKKEVVESFVIKGNSVGKCFSSPMPEEVKPLLKLRARSVSRERSHRAKPEVDPKQREQQRLQRNIAAINSLLKTLE